MKYIQIFCKVFASLHNIVNHAYNIGRYLYYYNPSPYLCTYFSIYLTHLNLSPPDK